MPFWHQRACHTPTASANFNGTPDDERTPTAGLRAPDPHACTYTAAPGQASTTTTTTSSAAAAAAARGSRYVEYERLPFSPLPASLRSAAASRELD